MVIQPNRKQIEGGFLGTLASIGIPMAITLVSKMFDSGLQVDRHSSSNTANVYVPPPPRSGKGYYPPPITTTLFRYLGKSKRNEGKKKKSKGKGLLLGKNSPLNSILILGSIL